MTKWETGRELCKFSKARIESLKDGGSKGLFHIGYKPTSAR
jgi:hypothetical protein